MGILEIVGAVFIWVIGFGLALYVPIFAVPLIWSTGEGLSDLAIGVFWGKVLAATYVLVTVAYLAAT